MRKTEEYLKEQYRVFKDDIKKINEFQFIPVSDMKAHMLLAIKQAQIDAIEETVKLCAENVEFKWDENENELFEINKDSILNCAEILKQQL